MATFLMEQLTSIMNTADAKSNYKNNFQNITTNIIPSINAQLQRYEIDANEAIKTEILQELTSEINFDSIKQEVMNDLKNGNVRRLERVSSHPQCNEHVSLIDMSLISQPDNDTTEMKDHLTSTLQLLRSFEDGMCSYKVTFKKYIQSCVPNLVTNYESVVRKAWKNKSEFPKLRDYMISEINKLLDA